MTVQAKKILIVEDEIPLQDVLADTFVREGFIVFVAENGEEGLTVAIEERPDIILLDIIMPKMGGLAMLKKLREDEWGKTAEVMILSNSNDIAKISEALQGRVFTYIVKTDWNLKDIVQKVKESFGVQTYNL